ncbi:MAG: LytTR family DNA-binding domain-containing protein [Eubacteriales bacterium]
MNLNVAIVEDEEVYANHLGNSLHFWATQNEASVELEIYQKENLFLQGFSQGGRFDVVFLDIFLPDGNGMDAAKQIRKYDPFLPIIFITRSSEYMGEGYEVWAMHYLIKPAAYSDIALCMDRVIQLKRQNTELVFSYKSDGMLRVIAYSDIYYFQSNQHYIEAHTKKEQIRFRGNINSLETELPSQFLRCNRSTIVNLSYLYSYDAKTNGRNVKLLNSDNIHVGDFYAKKVKEKCMEMFL